MTVIIQAMQAKVTPEEVKSKLTPEQLKKAKGKVLVPYTVAEEGKSNPAVEGQHQVLTWPRAVIEKVKNKIKSGTKLFHRHGKTNSHAGRKPVGEILTTYTKEIGGKLRAISIACMDAAEAAIFDICSIEAAVYMDDGIVGDVENITALAVDNSKNDKPAFANAKRMAMVQCFTSVESEDPGEGKDKYMPVTQEEINNAPFSMIVAAVKAKEVMPRQLFTIADLEKDNEFGPVLKAKSESEKKVEELTKTLEEKDKALTDVNRKISESSAMDLFTEMLPKNLTDTQEKYFKESFDPKALETVDKDSVKAEIDNLHTAYKKHAKLFGIDKDDDDTEDGGDINPTDPPKEGTEALNEAFDAL